MDEGGGSTQIVRFESFEADLQSGELRKHGVKVPLPGQPFQVLSVLLQHSGKLVTREALRQDVWPEDTFVDFDHGLNTAITKIRAALGDSAENPRFVETLSKRGYRFIAAINHENASAATPADLERLKRDTTSGKTAAVAAVAPAASGKFRWIGVLAAVIAVLAIAATFVWLRLPQTPSRVLATTQVTNDGLEKVWRLLRTDGARLYFTGNKGQWKPFLAQASVAGGDTSTLPFFTSATLFDISPDHSRLLVAKYSWPDLDDAEFWEVPLPGGPPRRIADVKARNGCWSPDGRELAFAKDLDIYLADAEGRDPRRLVTLAQGTSGASLMQFSPDGSRIRFSIWKEGLGSIWEIRTDGTQLHPLLPGWQNSASKCCGVWSPDGRYFFFVSPYWFGGNIWVLEESNSAFRKYHPSPVQLTFGPMIFSAITPSPDGKKLFAEGLQRRGELIRYDAQRHAFVPFLGGISASDLRFSRDGKWVAYVSYPAGTLWRSQIDGSDRLQLTSPPIFAAVPRWSPDGTQIAFMDLQAGRPWKILLISANGGVTKEMLAENLIQSDPEWSPDGKKMVFDRHVTEDSSIQLLDLNTKQLSLIPGSRGLWSSRWSPDGRYLAALSTPPRKIVIFDFKTQKWSDWVSGTATRGYGYPAWSRDGEYLYFEVSGQGDSGYYRIKLGQTRPELVVDLEDLKRVLGAGGAWSGITPDGSPLFLRNVSISEIYALDLDLP